MMCENPFIRNKKLKNNSGVASRLRDKQYRLYSMPLPCGKCLPCVINKRRVWTHRIMLESMCHSDCCFVTLTYDDKSLPDPPDLSKSELSGYIKRVRTSISPKKLRFFAIGEYGTVGTLRPHYHIVFFGVGMNNEKEFKKAWYRPEHKAIEMVDVGELNIKTAKYIAGYTTEKIANKDKRLFGREKEFMTCSKRPNGIGAGACAIIGKNIKKSYEKRGKKPEIHRELQIGKQKFPLGRYLTKKVAENAGLDETDFAVDLWEFQRELFDKHLFGSENFYVSLKNEKAAIRVRQERLHRMFNRKTKV